MFWLLKIKRIKNGFGVGMGVVLR